MGFEQLAELRQQLAAQAKSARQNTQAKRSAPTKPGAPAQNAPAQAKPNAPEQAKSNAQVRPNAPAKPGAPARPSAQAKPARAKAATPRAKKQEPVDPLVESIWRLQKHFPQTFPKKPASKVPLKLGILKDAAEHLDVLGLTQEQLQQAIASWCQGSRYWACMVENAPRVDLQGEVAGSVTADQAAHARRQASRRPNGRPLAGRNRRAGGAEGKPESAAGLNNAEGKPESAAGSNDADSKPESAAGSNNADSKPESDVASNKTASVAPGEGVEAAVAADAQQNTGTASGE